MKKTSHRNVSQIFAAPLVVAIVSAFGLVAALVGDGWWDASSWAALAVPVLLCLFFLCWRKLR
jgi:hypothetical protein